jgi:HPt (histidine-containing phosphotransfer) domain-containing protein
VLAGIWERSKKTITERIEILKHAQGLVAEGRLDEGVRLSAVDAAHKLAGVLGTFGLPRGTELAREAEQIFERKEALSHEAGQRLGALVAELDSLMKKAGPSVRGDTV